MVSFTFVCLCFSRGIRSDLATQFFGNTDCMWFFILINQRRIYNKLVVGSVIIVYLFCLFSITINGFKSGSIAILGIPISFFIMFDTIKQYNFWGGHLNFIFYLLLAWSFAPLILCIIPSLRYSFFLRQKEDILHLAALLCIVTFMVFYWEYCIYCYV